MNTKKQRLQKGIVETLLLLGLTAIISAGIYFYNKPKLGAIPNEIAFFEDSLASKITSTQTTMTLVKGTNKTGNIASSTYGFVIDEGSAQEEVVICDCTATACTNCKRGISDVDGQTETTALKFEHRRGATVKMTDHPSLIRLIRSVNGTDAIDGTMYYKTSPSSPSSTAVIDRAWLDTTSTANFVYLTGDQTIAGQKTFSGTSTFDKNVTIPLVPVALTDAASKQYVDSVAIAGAASSSATVYGFSKLSTAPADANFPIAVGDNDDRVQHTTINFGSAATTTVTTSISSGYNALVWGTNQTNGVFMYLCAKRPTGATTSLATAVPDVTGVTIPTTLMGIYTNPTTTTEVVEFYISTSTCSGVSANTANSGVYAGRINYVLIK
jgi:hypothetical protein